MNQKHLIFLAFILAGFALQAQTEKPVNPYYIFLNANLQGGIPTGAWANNTNKMAFGTGGLLLFQIGKKPAFSLGAELGWMAFDAETRRFDTDMNGADKKIRLTTSSGMVTAHALARFKPHTDFWIQPYVDGMFGTKGLFTTSLIIDESNGLSSTTDFDKADFALSYGAAVGLQFKLFNDDWVVMDLRCAYMAGGDATYYARKDSTPDPIIDPLDAFELRTSKTSMLMPQIGVTININTRN